jgi:superfamily II DNA or RNA helicase
MLRQHQKQFLETIDGIIGGSGIKIILAYVTPGGGKSSLPVISGKLIEHGYADAICWIVPRKELQTQGEAVFMDPFFKRMFGVNLKIRSSTNEVDPCRGLNGFITTYNAIGTDKYRTVEADFDTRRYVLILDEYHHIEKGGVWAKSLLPLARKASFVILMTGTLGRGDGKEIAFTRYDDVGKPRLEDGQKTKVIRYTRSMALAEKAILPIKFYFIDGKLTWKDADENVIDITSFKHASLKENSAAIYTALNTDYSKQLLTKAVNHWANHRKENPDAKLLVVTDGYDNAVKCVSMLKNNGIPAEIATSHKAMEAITNIRWFKQGLPVLVTIAMAYEGMDVPAITHLACLTHIRSPEWIEQMLARAVRVDKNAGPYESQMAYVFAPTDKKFLSVVTKINSEQASVVKQDAYSKKAKEYEEIPEIFDPDGRRSEITPLFGCVLDMDKQTIQGGKITTRVLVETPKDQELRLRRDISKHINTFCALNRYREEAVNSDIKKAFGKPRAMMTLKELNDLWTYIQAHYPVAVARGTGRVPVSKKATPFCPETVAVNQRGHDIPRAGPKSVELFSSKVEEKPKRYGSPKFKGAYHGCTICAGSGCLACGTQRKKSSAMEV